MIWAVSVSKVQLGQTFILAVSRNFVEFLVQMEQDSLQFFDFSVIHHPLHTPHLPLPPLRYPFVLTNNPISDIESATVRYM